MQRVPETRHFESRPIPNPTHQRKTQLRYPKGNQENFLGIKIDIFGQKKSTFLHKNYQKNFPLHREMYFCTFCFILLLENSRKKLLYIRKIEENI